MSNDRLEPFNYHNIAFKWCADVVSLERLDRLWFFRHHWFVKIGWFGKCWTDLLAFWGVWNRSRILNFGPDRLFFRFSRALIWVYTFPIYNKVRWENYCNTLSCKQIDSVRIWIKQGKMWQWWPDIVVDTASARGPGSSPPIAVHFLTLWHLVASVAQGPHLLACKSMKISLLAGLERT